ncbi:MAG: type III-B CRISPR module RAMP protein Cmr1 [Oscillochloris sp.]|nr:type III-B CRISPR module RAMP protein Cmr1 [Oscillochloris sp.]
MMDSVWPYWGSGTTRGRTAMRRPDPGPPPELTLKERNGYITQTRSYKLITPLFGGGIEPQRPDPVTVVRATSIRGQLRFWWRATRGGNYTTVAELKKAEDALWGAASNEKGGGPSKVEIALYTWTKPKEVKAFIPDPRNSKLTVGEPRSPYSYGAFPLNETRGSVYEHIEFTISISFPNTAEDRLDVEAALWAWETFGGIGGRTRRGFGALELLQVDGVAPDDRPAARREDVVRWLRQRLETYTTGAILIREWPQVTADSLMVITQPYSSPLEGWKFLIKQLRQFRNRQLNRWPDADSVRRITKQSYKGKSAIPAGRNIFPRAVFGLPIIFHFKDNNRGDPDDATLQGVAHDRLASPLILRPLACADNRYIGLALVLHAPRTPPDGLKLKGYAPSDPLTIKLNDEEAANVLSLNGKTDVLRAFLDYLEGAAK